MDFLVLLVHGSLLWAVICAILCCIAVILFWELFSPLHAFPGPPAARFTNIWRAMVTASGHVDQANIKWHRTYGSAVRVGPNTISINDPELIRTIYATKNPWPKVPTLSFVVFF